ncbi:MAG: lipid A biosynthesis acyltransferase [Bacteroidetes bacterium]|nr:MAG: lipid A biosynthesis acyltransferase [Bacteroidota bacterium]REK00639.1 MAG: lipid A biosynthesis acyltransferase [Bacteroidota bacterium]REK35239.1 MAG: lipid A biosynthesis acyltransferase [Bacteroidota bacterium]
MKHLPSIILYYLVIMPVSMLPFRLMYLLSDFTFFILFYITPYRKKVVMSNLRNSFPEKTEAELKVIMKRFYRHFCDLIFESLKTFTASQNDLLKRVTLENTSLLEEFYKKNKSLILATGHYGNWEWPAITLPYHSSHLATGIYQRLSNQFFDQKLRKTRAKFGMKLMSTREVADFFEAHRNDLCTYGFINDQSPSDPKRGHWMKFLNQDTCVFTGVEKYAQKYDYPVLYGRIVKLKRGHYKLSYELVSDEPRTASPNEITEKCARINEELIRQDPAFWLWTHRRWKHKKM